MTKNKTKKSTANKALDKMIAKLEVAKKNGEKSVVIFETKRSSHKAKTNSYGLGVEDLKPKLYETYKHMLINYDVRTRLVSLNEMKVEWIVKIKK